MSATFAPRTQAALAAAEPARGGWRLLVTLLLVVVVSLFLPWQQSVRGSGRVTALNPEDRPQVVPALIAGRIDRWHVTEGALVRRGDVLVDLSETTDAYLDPRTLDRTREQASAKRAAIEAKQRKVVALDTQRDALDRSRALGAEQAVNALMQAEAARDAAVADSVIAQRQLERNRQLLDEGLRSRAEFEAYELKAQLTVAKLVEAQRKVANARLSVRSVDAEYGEKSAKVLADRSTTQSEVAEGRADLAKLDMLASAIEVRRGMYRVVAPQDGYVVRAVRAGIGESIKAGDPLVTIMPAKPRIAVEMSVKAMDIPLLSSGRHVRLQFDGWPALQFSGWPSAAVGTFGGEIRVLDAVSAPDGTYRVLVVPDSANAWPAELRIGSGVIGWAMLDDVRVWYELWRRFNGFPPSVAGNAQPTSGGEK